MNLENLSREILKNILKLKKGKSEKKGDKKKEQ